MVKTFKEYMTGLGGFRLGNLDSFRPIASLGDRPPKGQGNRDSRGVGLVANYSGQAPGTMRPFLTAAKKIQDKNKKDKEKIKEDVNEVSDKLKLKVLARKIARMRDKFYKNLRPKGLFAGEDTKRIPKKPGQKDKSDKHSDLYTDEDPKGTIHGLGFTDGAKARQSVNKIKNSGRTHAHKIQAAIAMSQRAKVASQRAKDPKKKKDLGQAHKVYQNYIDTNKKSKD